MSQVVIGNEFVEKTSEWYLPNHRLTQLVDWNEFYPNQSRHGSSPRAYESISGNVPVLVAVQDLNGKEIDEQLKHVRHSDSSALVRIKM